MASKENRVRESHKAQYNRYDDEGHSDHEQRAPSQPEHFLGLFSLWLVFANEAHSVRVVSLSQFVDLGLVLSTELPMTPKVEGHHLEPALEFKLIVAARYKAEFCPLLATKLCLLLRVKIL